eukprot:scaffold11336_cov133-Isochrysis_galbana.AAC.2
MEKTADATPNTECSCAVRSCACHCRGMAQRPCHEGTPASRYHRPFAIADSKFSQVPGLEHFSRCPTVIRRPRGR